VKRWTLEMKQKMSVWGGLATAVWCIQQAQVQRMSSPAPHTLNRHMTSFDGVLIFPMVLILSG
jgi:hypothetical protein